MSGGITLSGWVFGIIASVAACSVVWRSWRLEVRDDQMANARGKNIPAYGGRTKLAHVVLLVFLLAAIWT